MKKIPIYLVVKKTGQFAPDGEELYIVYAARLTRGIAENDVENNPGFEIIKRYADK